VTLVPGGLGASSTATSLPPSTSTLVPTGSSALLVRISILETAAMEARASPRNPRVVIPWRSSSEEILEVVCLSTASTASSLDIPQPSS